MRTWRPLVFAAGVIIAISGLAAAVYFNQSIIAIVSVLVAVFTALSPTVVPSLSDEIQANNSRYERHRTYFADVILPQAGSMLVLQPHGIRLVPEGNLAWKIGLGDRTNPVQPGRDESRLPAYQEVFLPHLDADSRDPVWTRLKETWLEALSSVQTYTEARRRFDTTLFQRMDGLIRTRVGNDFEADWSDARSVVDVNNRHRYQAAAIRDCCEYTFEGRYEQPGWRWINPAVAGGNQLVGGRWGITQGDGSMPFLWGGAPPENLEGVRDAMNEILVSLRADEGLKALYETSLAAEETARIEALPLSNAAEDAAHLLRHGPDIPGECSYCKDWHPRF